MVSINKKCKTKENPNGTIKNWKLKKVKNKNGKIGQKMVVTTTNQKCDRQRKRGTLQTLNNMIGSITGNERRPTCRGRYKVNTQKYYASMLYEIYALSNKCTCEYGTFTGKKQSEYTGKQDCSELSCRVVSQT